MDYDDIDATQVLDLGYDVQQEETPAKREVGNLKTLSHKTLSEQICPVYEGTNIIGRDDRSDIIIKLQSLSKKHACIEVTDGYYILYDLDSRNKSKKGEMLLKPYIRYELKDGDLLTFGDLTCEFIATPCEDLDETKSLSGSETGSESLIPEEEEEVLYLSDDVNSLVNNINIMGCADERDLKNVSSLSDCIIMPTQYQKEDVNSSGLSDSVILPTQDATYTKKTNSTFMKNKLTEEREEDTYAAETDSEPEDSEERGDTPPEAIVAQTPGLTLGQRTKSCVLESPIVEDECSNDKSLLLESPLVIAESNSNMSEQEFNFPRLGSKTNNFIHNVVFRTPPTHITADDVKSGDVKVESDDEEIAGTYVFDTAGFEGDEKVESDDEEIAGTYVFDTAGFEGECGDFEDSEENMETGVMDNKMDNNDLAIDPINDIANANLEEEGKEDNMKTYILDDNVAVDPLKDIAKADLEEKSQVIGYIAKKDFLSAPIFGSCGSFGTTASSISSNLDNPVEKDSAEVVEDSEDMATQPYQISSPKNNFNSPIKENLKTKSESSLCTLPGGSFSEYYDKIDIINANNYDDIATQMYTENQNDTPVATGINMDTYFDAVDTATDMHADEAAGTVFLKNNDTDNLDDVCTQMYQVPPAVSVDEKGDESDSSDIETDTAETQLFLNATHEIPLPDTDKEDANSNNDIYDDMATQLYTTDNNCYDDVSTQLYAVESTNLDKESTQGSNILHDSDEIPDNKSNEVNVAISTRASKKRKRKSVRFSLDGVNMFMHTRLSGEPNSEDETEVKKSKTEKNGISALQQTKSCVKKSKKAATLKRTSPSVIELLQDEDTTDINNDEKLSEIHGDKEPIVEKLNLGETNIELKQAENKTDIIKEDGDKKRGNDKKTYPSRLKRGKQLCEADNESDESIANAGSGNAVDEDGEAVESGSKGNLVSNSKSKKVAEQSQSQIENLSENIAINENSIGQKVENKFKENVENVDVGGKLDVNVTTFESNTTKYTRNKKTYKPPKPKNGRKLKEQPAEVDNKEKVKEPILMKGADNPTRSARSKRQLKSNKFDSISENVAGNSELNTVVIEDVEEKSGDVTNTHKVPARSKRNRNPSKTKPVKENNVLTSVGGKSDLNTEATEEVEEKSDDITYTHTVPARSKRNRNPSKTEAVKEIVLVSVACKSDLNTEFTDDVEEKSDEVTNTHKVPARSKRNRNPSKTEPVKENVIDAVAVRSELNTEFTEDVEEKTDEVINTDKVSARSKRNINQSKSEPVKGNVLDPAGNSDLTTEVAEDVEEKLDEVTNTHTLPARSKRNRNQSKTKIPVVTTPARSRKNTKQTKVESYDDNTCPTTSENNENILKESKSGRSERTNKPNENNTCNDVIPEVGKQNEELKNNKTDKKVKSKGKQKEVAHVNNLDINSNSNTTEQLDNNIKSDMPGTPRRSTSAEKPKVVFTGMNDKSLEKIVTDLGGEVVDNVLTATHLVTDKVRRTVKFLCAVGRGIHIIHPEWLTSSKSSKCFTACHRHMLNDEAAERQYKFQLLRTLEKANETPLFLNKKIYVTKNVKPERKYLKEIVESAGGTYISRVPRTPSEDVIIVSCPEDEKEYQKLVKKGFVTCAKEIILTGMLRQELDTEHYSIENIADLNTSQMSLSDTSIVVTGSKRKANNPTNSPKKEKRKR